MFKSIEIKTSKQSEMIEVLKQVKDFVTQSGVLHGVVVVTVPHTTAAVTLNKNYDAGVKNDVLVEMDELVPQEGKYTHIEGNSAANVKSALFGNSLTVIIDDGRLELGMFQSIFLCEFAGPRKRKVLMKIMEG
ncbi:secondary thiamine-phosphate synthase enzyme YjbQ [Fusibacter tunisiensis]|uniref:Secondary thiamine-phosphate synthase enzyme n=1 Tax=Fusibacter tunisiensis TaxID=1008308 RepID=A0ABS2MRF8_9FIRM|nr:secondary thiamine-phosphate synthase enzyme YjbQ [Fusibacter tunisiensis]MBM7561998.1 secondary thiamine-phosphate synthase enzyme [Fusibacter tunisiensis]